MDPPMKEPHFSCLPSSESLNSPLGILPNVGSFSSYSDDIGKTSKTEDTFIVGEYHLSSCPICLERFTLDNPAILVVCGHGFHLQCLEDWRQRSCVCPVCMKPMHGEGVPMMSARETRRRRRYRGVRTNNSSSGKCEQQQYQPSRQQLYTEEDGVEPVMAPLRCTPALTEEHALNNNNINNNNSGGGGAMWTVICALRSLSRWCSRDAE